MPSSPSSSPSGLGSAPGAKAGRQQGVLGAPGLPIRALPCPSPRRGLAAPGQTPSSSGTPTRRRAGGQLLLVSVPLLLSRSSPDLGTDHSFLAPRCRLEGKRNRRRQQGSVFVQWRPRRGSGGEDQCLPGGAPSRQADTGCQIRTPSPWARLGAGKPSSASLWDPTLAWREGPLDCPGLGTFRLLFWKSRTLSSDDDDDFFCFVFTSQ